MHSKLNPKYHNIFLHSLASALEILAYLLQKSALQAKGTATPAAVFLGLKCRSSFGFQHMCAHTGSCQPVKAWGPARNYKGCSCHDNWEGKELGTPSHPHSYSLTASFLLSAHHSVKEPRGFTQKREILSHPSLLCFLFFPAPFFLESTQRTSSDFENKAQGLCGSWDLCGTHRHWWEVERGFASWPLAVSRQPVTKWSLGPWCPTPLPRPLCSRCWSLFVS